MYSRSIRSLLKRFSTTGKVPGTGQATHVLFSADGDFWCDYDVSISAVPPAANVTNGQSPELNPTMRAISDVTTLYLMAASTVNVTLMFAKA
jgi:hypothetical protein